MAAIAADARKSKQLELSCAEREGTWLRRACDAVIKSPGPSGVSTRKMIPLETKDWAMDLIGRSSGQPVLDRTALVAAEVFPAEPCALASLGWVFQGIVTGSFSDYRDR